MESVPSGVYPTKSLQDTVGVATVARLIREQKAIRIRRGWIAVGNAPQDQVLAVRRGGVLSCMSALKRQGVWVPEDINLHVRGNQWAVRNRKGPFCRRFGRPEPEYGAMDDIPTALTYAARCLDAEGFVVVCDSLLHLKLMSFAEIEHLFGSAPDSLQRLLGRLDARAESGPESMMRFRLQSKNVDLEIQVEIDGVGRVDMLIGQWLIIEIDGYEYHGGKPMFTKDRLRFAAAHNLGYTPLGFSYEQVVFDQAATLDRIMTAIRNGAHRRPSQLAKPTPLRPGMDL